MLYLRFRHQEDCARVVALLGRLGVEVREKVAGIGSRQTGVGAPAQLGTESQIHSAMEEQQRMAALPQMGSTTSSTPMAWHGPTPSSAYAPSWSTQHPHQRQLQSSQPQSQPDPQSSYQHGFTPSQQSQQSTFANPYSRRISDHSYPSQHQDTLSTPSRQMRVSAVGSPLDPQTRQRTLTEPEASQQGQISTQQQYDPERSYEFPAQMHSQQHQVVKYSDRRDYPGSQGPLQITQMQHPAPYSSSSTLSQPRNFEHQHSLPSQAFEPRDHANGTQPRFPTPFTLTPDEEGIPPPRMPISFTQRKVLPDVSIEEYLSLPPLPKPTIVPRPKRLLTPEATPSTKKSAPAEPRAKPKPEAVTAVASSSGREGVAVENPKKPKETAGVLQAGASGVGAESVADKAQDWSGQREEPAAIPKEAKKPARSRAKPKPKPKVVEEEVAGLATELVGDKAQDRDTGNRSAATVTIAKKPARSRAKPKPKPAVVEAEAADLATGIVGDKARDKNAEGGGPEEENRSAATATIAKKPARSRAKPKPKPAVEEAEVAGLETGIVGDKARDRDAEGGGPEEENRPAATATIAKKPARSRAKPKPKPAVVEAEVADLATGIVDPEEENGSAATVTIAKKPARSRAKPKPKPAVAEAEVAGLEIGIVGDKARDRDAEGGGPEEENRPAAPVTTAKKLARPRAKPNSARPVANSPARELASGLITPVSSLERQASADSRTVGHPLTTLSSPGSRKRGEPPSKELQPNPPQRRRIVVSSNVIPPTPPRDGEDALSLVTSPGASIQDRGSPPSTQAVPLSTLSPTSAPVDEPSYLLSGIELLDPRLYTLATASTLFQDAARRLDFENVSEENQNLTIKLLISDSSLGPHFARVFQAIVRACRNRDFVWRMMGLSAVSLEYSGLLAPTKFDKEWLDGRQQHSPEL